MKKLILLYGALTGEHNAKYQGMIDGKFTCGYRSYAEAFGEIIYLSPQTVRLPWEKSIYKSKRLIEYLNSQPDALVWAVKHDPNRDRKVLRHVKNKKVYYSCNAKNSLNKSCHISLIDTKSRITSPHMRVWFKGKDPNFWKPESVEKEYDYLLVGKRADKNEIHFLNRLDFEIQNKRKILWIGGEKHSNKVNLKNHFVKFTHFCSPEEVVKSMSKAKVGILYTSHPMEGFPQTFLEMTMMGIPVLYHHRAPRNHVYIKEGVNCLISNSNGLITNAEKLLSSHDSTLCREYAIENYSLEKSYQNILRMVQ